MDDLGGFFKVYRKSVKSRFWDKSPVLVYRGFWVTLLMMANWQDGWFDGHPIKTGQFATSTRSLSKLCKKSDKQIRVLLDHFSKMGMITASNVANRFTMITICNWDIYNGNKRRTSFLHWSKVR